VASISGPDGADTISAQALDLAFPNVPGFKGQGWSTQETVMAVRWLFSDPAAWARAMAVARAYPENPHTVADTLHEQIVPRPELTAIARGGGDPAKVNWLEIAHELIERRGDPQPAQEHGGIAAQALDLAGGAAAGPGDPPVPDDPTAIAMTTAHLLDDTARHLAHASGRLDAAREATPGDLAGHHMAHCARSLDGAHKSAHDLAAHLRSHYPAEGADLDALCATIGLAVSVSDQARTATTGHLVQTICNHLGHTIEHVKAMQDDPDPKVRGFNGEHARTHMDGALEHVGKLTRHLRDNYPAEAKWLAGLRETASQMADPGMISGQVALAGRPKADQSAAS